MIASTLLGRRAVSALLTVAALVGGSSIAARAQGYALPDPERWFRVEWQPGQNKKGRPIVSGYVYELWGRPADSMQLGIDRLDASGAVTGTQIAYVNGMIPAGGRAYFEIPVAAAPGYRVRVVWYRWVGIGGGP